MKHPTSNNNPTQDDANSLTDRRKTWISLYTLLAEGLKHPDKQFHRDVQDDSFAVELAEHTDRLGISVSTENGDPTHAPETPAAFDTEYISLFEGLVTPYAPLIESVYRPWHSTWQSDGLLLGPAATDMRSRYDIIGVSTPDAYADDHLALMLEYAALLLQHKQDSAYQRFIEQHLDWLPALRRLATEAAADAPFHRHCVTATCEIIATARKRNNIDTPNSEQVQNKYHRAREHIR